MKTIDQLRAELPPYEPCEHLNDSLTWTELVSAHGAAPSTDSATKLGLYAQLHVEAHAAQQPATPPAGEARDWMEDAQRLLEWNRKQKEPPIKIGYEYTVVAALSQQERKEGGRE